MLHSKFNSNLKLLFSSCIVSYIHFIVGCSFVFSSTILAKLRNPRTSVKLNDDQASWIASIPYLVCPIGLLIVGTLTDKIGSRKALQVAYIPIIFGWLILSNATTINAIIIGRAIIGLTMGSGTCALLYLAEICPTSVRPLYLSMGAMFVGVGMTTESVLALFLHWQNISAVLFVSSAIGCGLLFFLPESPLWLRAHGRIADAKKAEMWFGTDTEKASTMTKEVSAKTLELTSNLVTRGAAAIDMFTDVSVAIVKETTVGVDGYYNVQRSRWSTYLHPTVWKPTLITLAFFVCQQGSGVYVLLFYSVDVLRDCQIPWDGLTITVFLCAARVVGSIVFTMLHTIGRKSLTVFSSVGMAVSLFVIVGYIKVYRGAEIPASGNVVLIIAFVLYVFFALFAMLQLPWMLCSEVFPMTVKGVMSGVVNIVGYELMFLTTKIYPKMVLTFGIENVWLIYAVFCMLGGLFGAFIMPETKGKSLNEILYSFESKRKPQL